MALDPIVIAVIADHPVKQDGATPPPASKGSGGAWNMSALGQWCKKEYKPLRAPTAAAIVAEPNAVEDEATISVVTFVGFAVLWLRLSRAVGLAMCVYQHTHCNTDRAIQTKH